MSKVIAGYTYLVDFSKFGIQAFSLLLKTRSHSEKLTQVLLSFCDEQPNVAYLTENLGAFDYKMGVHLLEASAIVPFTQRLFDCLAEEMVACCCLTSFDYLKVKRYPFTKAP